MASLAIGSGGTTAVASHISKSQFLNDDRSSLITSLPISNFAVKKLRPKKICALSMTLSSSDFPVSSSSFDRNNLTPLDRILNEEFSQDVESRVSEKLDVWMRDSVGDIVKNLKQAPLLVQVYANNNGSTEVIKTEKAVRESWPDVMKESPSPDGVILVEELGRGGKEEGKDQLDSGSEGTKAWGVLIQGKGSGERECGSACYLLKTSRVGGGLGGLLCTHFCLVKVKNFRDSALAQLSDSWLLQ